MNHFISLPLKDGALHGIMSDLRVNYALSPFHRIGFEIDDPGIKTLPERYHDRALSREVAERIAAARIQAKATRRKLHAGRGLESRRLRAATRGAKHRLQKRDQPVKLWKSPAGVSDSQRRRVGRTGRANLLRRRAFAR